MPVRYYKVIYYRDTQKEWRSRIKAPNGRVVFDSGEGYKSLLTAKTAVQNFFTGVYKEEVVS